MKTNILRSDYTATGSEAPTTPPSPAFGVSAWLMQWKICFHNWYISWQRSLALAAIY